MINKNESLNIISYKEIVSKIYIIRGKKVMLDNDLAVLYNVQTKRLKEQVRRNIKRFPDDFMFELTKAEYDSLRSQFATLKKSRGQHSKYMSMAFTEQGISMLSSVLNSERAIQINIQIIRTFTKLKEMIFINNELRLLVEKMDRRLDLHSNDIKKNKKDIQILANLIQQLLQPAPSKPKKKIGFITDD